MRAGGNIGLFDCNWFQGSLRPREKDVGDTLAGSIAAITHNMAIAVPTSCRFMELLEQHSGETKHFANFEFRFGIQCYMVER